ncbi:GNAT family N-acetyltransferase [Polaribacter sp. SA4-10]|uniref:GNAT family N-acetyltransferase n=1 Tax=Polaribacter sp. SA4-10 TaxID=754397 RepID=UPI000B3C6E22|nr:GNAT family N-acetyltransferase [Polaribacter sp. SA4-10]ARV07407.1 GNAT family N-acetyltransferase [Polaribacter sp. SA4-10]
MIIPATLSDAKSLTDIALKSKSFWGYSNEQLESWTDELTVSENMIEEMLVFKFLEVDEVAGFYILNQPKNQTIELEFLFVLPKFIGLGIGKKLVQHSCDTALELACKSINLLADLNAESFYKSQGFKTISQKESTVFNRFLPVMEKDLVR